MLVCGDAVVTVEVYRWSADEKEKPYIQSYKVPARTICVPLLPLWHNFV